MRGHELVIELDKATQRKLDEGYLVFPEHVDERDYRIECLDVEQCGGWQECLRQHLCKHGFPIEYDDLSIEGACPGMVDRNCIGEDDEEIFHGEHHTYRWGWRWTVEFKGCIVNEVNWDYDDVNGDSLPRGRYGIDDDWDDDSVYLELCYSVLP